MKTIRFNNKMVSREEILNMDTGSLRQRLPAINDFFSSFGLPLPEDGATISHFILDLDEETLNDIAMEREAINEVFLDFIEGMLEMQKTSGFKLFGLTIIGGHDKDGKLEELNLELRPSQIICLVGHTGSGKSRLLADIEWMARGDTPTGRKILINGDIPPSSWRHSHEHRLVAQLTQNMNFVMDVAVDEFVRLHAESRLVENVEAKTDQIILKANDLAGEPFAPDTPVTSLSGGQSRALMIADIALLSASPIVLIDEIENAGIDRKRALELLIGEEKIVLIATHDPILALMGEKRLILRNGGVCKIINTTSAEKRNLSKIEELDKIFLGLRNRIRNGELIDFEIGL